MQHITAPELAAWLDDASRAQPVLLDVREEWEVALGKIDGAAALPMQTIPERLQELDQDAVTVCICHHGSRSASSDAARLYAGDQSDWRHACLGHPGRYGHGDLLNRDKIRTYFYPSLMIKTPLENPHA